MRSGNLRELRRHLCTPPDQRGRTTAGRYGTLQRRHLQFQHAPQRNLLESRRGRGVPITVTSQWSRSKRLEGEADMVGEESQDSGGDEPESPGEEGPEGGA